MGKERPKDIIRLRIRGTTEAVKLVNDSLQRLYQPGIDALANKQGCRVGRVIETGPGRRSRQPEAEVHIQVPMAIVLNSLKSQSINDTVGQTTTEEKQDS